MPPAPTASARPRSRPIGMGYLRALEAVARTRNFRLAAEDLSLTQSAVSRQIQALEDEVGVALFLRHTRSVELTPAGAELLRASAPALERIDRAVRQIRQSAGRRTVTLNTWASFASLWLIPRLEAFQTEYPEIDIRIDATDKTIDIEHGEADLALRYTRPEKAGPLATRLFGEQLTPVASPWLRAGKPALRDVKDLAQHALVEATENHRGQVLPWLGWRRWLDAHGPAGLEPRRWLYFNYAHQILQAALAGQGVALARLPLVADSLAGGSLVEVFDGLRMDTPFAYYLMTAPHSAGRPEIQAFREWLLAQAALTRKAIGEDG